MTKTNDNFQTIAAIVKVFFLVYSVLQPLLLIVALVGIFWSIKKIYKREVTLFSKEFLATIISCGNFILSVAYALALAWFVEFIWMENRPLGIAALKFYSVGLIPMLMTMEIFGTYLFFTFRKKNSSMSQIENKVD